MTANNSKSYLSYLNKLVDQYKNIFHHSNNKNYFNADYSVLTENIEANFKVSKFEVKIEWELLSIRIFLVKVTLTTAQEKCLFWKLIPGHIKLKIWAKKN